MISKILSVAVRFDEILSLGEAFGEALSAKDAVLKIKSEAGVAFDPVVIDTLEVAHRDGTLYNQEKLLNLK